jgi:hypothetical protein
MRLQVWSWARDPRYEIMPRMMGPGSVIQCDLDPVQQMILAHDKVLGVGFPGGGLQWIHR